MGKSTLVKALADHCHGQVKDTPGPVLSPLRGTILEFLGDSQIARCLFFAASVFAVGAHARAIADGSGVVFVDRYWLSTIAYARARGVLVDLSALEAVVPMPDMTVLVTLDEEERQQRLGCRSHNTQEERETFDHEFCEMVLREMRCKTRLPGLVPVEVDITGANGHDALQRVLSVLSYSKL